MSGGGTALINAIVAIDDVQAEGDEMTGVKLVKKAIEEPLRQIANNAGVEGSVVVEKVKAAEHGIGFNALTNVYENMIAAASSTRRKLPVQLFRMLPASLPWF